MDDVCVVTQPLGDTDPTATNDLLAILSAITTVSLVTIGLPGDSDLREEYEVVEVSDQPMGASIPVAAWRFVRNQVRMAFVVRRRPERIVLFYGSQAYLLPILVARLSGKTVVTEPRANVALSLRLQWERRAPSVVARVLAGAVRLLERAGYRLSHAVIAYTPGMAEELGLDRYEGKLYTDGARFVDTDRFDVEIPFEERDRVVGYVGRFAEEKGIRTLAAVARGLPEDVTFRFVGDGPLRGWLEAELAGEIERGSVEVRGWVEHDEVPAALNELRLLVMPSRPTEGLPTLLLESLACGTPVYASPVSGIPDVVEPGETGWLFDPDDDASRTSERVLRAIEGDELAEMSDAGRATIENEFSFDGAVERYQRILTAVVDG